MRFSALVFALISLPAFACPQLAGNYTVCRSSTGQTPGERDVVVSQRQVGGVMEYSVTGTDEETHERTTSTVIADGKPRTEEQTDPSTGISFSLTTTARCNGQTLLMDTSLSFSGQVAGQLKSSITKNGNQLVTKTEGMMMGQAVNETVTCQ